MTNKRLIKIGSSVGVIIPHTKLIEPGADIGVDVSVSIGRIKGLSPAKARIITGCDNFAREYRQTLKHLTAS